MPINPNIALAVRPPQIPDPMEGYGRAVQLSSLLQQQDLHGLQMRETRRKLQQDELADSLYRDAIDPETGALDEKRLVSAFAGQGLGSRIPAVQKGFLELREKQLGIRKTEGEIDKTRLEIAQKHLGAVNGMLGSLLARPEIGHQDVIDGVRGLVQQGVLSPEAGAEAVRQIPGNPQMLRSWLQQRALESVDAGRRLELTLPKLTQVNDGQTTRFVDTNPMTNPSGPAPITMRPTPEAMLTDERTRSEGALNRGVTIRGQNMTDARARETAGRPEWSEELRSWVFRPSNAAPAGAIVTATGPDGKPLPPRGLASDETNLRKEFADLPQVKSYTMATPAYKAIVDAASRNTRQADINLVYGLAKLYDPTSVVREGEYATIANSQAVPDWLKGLAQGLAGGSRLSPNTKSQVLVEARGRIGAFQQEYDAARTRYVGIAQQRGMNPDNVIVPINVAPTPAAEPAAPGARPPLNAFQRKGGQ